VPVLGTPAVNWLSVYDLIAVGLVTGAPTVGAALLNPIVTPYLVATIATDIPLVTTLATDGNPLATLGATFTD
jgi:hypothetical protein